MRLTGFASGMDINQMVSDLMQAERMPLQKMEQDQNELVLKMGEYREVNRAFMDFRTNTFDTIMRRSNMDAKQVVSTNEALVSATANAGSDNGTYTISNVEQLATAAYNFSEEAIVENKSDFDPNGNLSEQEEFFAGGIERNAEQEIVFDMTTYDENGEAINVAFTFDEEASLNDVLSDINNSELGVQAFYDAQSGQVSMARTETGIYNVPEVEGEVTHEMAFNGSFLTDNLKLSEDNEIVAQNAEFNLNGLTTHRRSNDFQVNGLQVSLKNEFTAPVTLTVSNDTDEIFDNVMGFINDYNDMINMVNGKVSEEYFRDYAPLTDEQRREMSESEIELWEERAHSGLVRNDRLLTGALNNMRQDFYGTVDSGDFNQSISLITDIGITTTSNYQDRGRLEVDEEQLRNAIEEDPESVYQLFAADGETYEEQGIARRLRNTLSGQIEMISERAGRSEMASNQQFTIGRQLDQGEERISNFERRMQQVEQRYWAQFNAMEQAMAQANSQAEMLMSQLSGLGPQM
ncbi:flagellar hook-associated protein 2 [Evansella sp. AB-P1]|uniref:flagellar hook-associated protein 2 n=1 Tax=Evansella sp. AB-P1 TaxID=3037653 RepID=UPI00241DE2CD|nr:flagellar hook-associated protein 2 [Evansella sp. AB-P1]MDG5786663.1 flagellar hook-associated protein 2 [Evansella sp. AB-P1]